MISKECYVGRLFDKAEDISIIKKAYLQLVPVELSYRGLSPDSEMTLNDTVETAKCILSRGKQGIGDFASLQDGINRLKSFMYRGKYYIENAICDASLSLFFAGFLAIDFAKFLKIESCFTYTCLGGLVFSLYYINFDSIAKSIDLFNKFLHNIFELKFLPQ